MEVIMVKRRWQVLKSFSIEIKKNSQLDTRKYNLQVLQIKNFVENYFVIYCSEYASGVRNLYCQEDSLF